jgi:hypothetical protein
MKMLVNILCSNIIENVATLFGKKHNIRLVGSRPLDVLACGADHGGRWPRGGVIVPAARLQGAHAAIELTPGAVSRRRGSEWRGGWRRQTTGCKP